MADGDRPVRAATPWVLITPDDLAEIAAVECPECREGRGINLELAGGEIAWQVVQTHSPHCVLGPDPI